MIASEGMTSTITSKFMCVERTADAPAPGRRRVGLRRVPTATLDIREYRVTSQTASADPLTAVSADASAGRL
jgi:hypothetical protein